MTLSLPWKSRSGGNGDDDTTSPSLSDLVIGSGGAAMRIIVPLQSIVQGRGGLVLGSVIPCALFYLFQLYLRRKRPSSSPSPSPSPLSGDLHALPGISRTPSRNLISPRASLVPALLSSRAAAVNKSDACRLSAGHRRYLDNRYHLTSNPDGVIQLGLVENQVVYWASFFYSTSLNRVLWFIHYWGSGFAICVGQLSLDLAWGCLERNVNALSLEEGRRNFGVGGMEAYLQYDGLLDLKIVSGRPPPIFAFLWIVLFEHCL